MMNKHYFRLGLFVALIFSGHLASAQPTIQDCLGAVPVCQDFYSETQAPTGAGNIAPEIQGGEICTDVEDNSIWYVFNVNEDGNLGFIITPNDLNDDYDWALFNLTGRDCDDIGFNTVVSCNAAGGQGCHGRTGCTVTGIGNNTPGGCAGTGPLNELVPMQAGETYVLMVSNWTGSRNGYTLDFSESTGLGVFDETPPFVELVNTEPQSCGDSQIELEFHEFMQCNSVFDNDFRLDGPGGPYVLRVSSTDCNSGSSRSKNFILSILPPIASMGNFTLVVEPAAGDHLLDLCDNQSLPFTHSFTVDVPLDEPVDIGRDTSLLCAGNELTLDASSVGIGWQWDDGSTNSTLVVTDEGVYGVTVTTVCGIGEDNVEVFVQQRPPVIDLGVDDFRCPGDEVVLDIDNGIAFYEWQDGSMGTTFTVQNTGTYIASVTNGCGTVIDSVIYTYVPPLNLALADEYVLCAGDTLQLDLSRPYAQYTWSDGSTDATQVITQDDEWMVMVSTLCETYDTDFSTTFLVDPVLDLGLDTLLCPRDTILLDATIPGSNYNWQDGQSESVLQVSVPGTYSVTVTTACNELTDNIVVEYRLPITTDLGRDTFLCPEDPFLLDASTLVDAKYEWEDGSSLPQRAVVGPAEYIVTVSSACETVIDTLSIVPCEICDVYLPNIFSPNLDGINDSFGPQSFCELFDYTFSLYDRWGNQVFESTDRFQKWDGRVNGKLASAGAYVYVLNCTVVENGYNRPLQERGDVVLLR